MLLFDSFLYFFKDNFHIINEKSMQSKESMYFVPVADDLRYRKVILPLLEQLAEGKLEARDVLGALHRFDMLMTNGEGFEVEEEDSKRLFTALREQSIMAQIDIVGLFQKIAKFVIGQQERIKTRKIKILQQGKAQSLQLSKEDVVYLLSLMILNLVPPQQYSKDALRSSKFQAVTNFVTILCNQAYKTRTLLQYFNHYFTTTTSQTIPQTFTISRNLITVSPQQLITQHSKKHMLPLTLTNNGDSIQNYPGHIKVDFANEYIGGGCMHGGCVQQQIMFANHPELYVSVVLCEVMGEREAIMLRGFRKYFKNKGYGFNVEYDGWEKLDQKFYETEEYIVAIDAMPFYYSIVMEQVTKKGIDRELIKAYAGFNNTPKNTGIITGNWGCGAFNGDIRTKFLIQWLACSMANKKMVYCPFDSKQLIEPNIKILTILQKKAVGQVYELLLKAGSRMKTMNENILEKIGEML